jgi:hypothetical protein
MLDSVQRRRHPRAKFCCFGRFRVLSVDLGDADRICVTRDFSHEGLYFLADSGAAHRECLVEVVRTHPTFAGRFGVAVKLLTLQRRVSSPNGGMSKEKSVSRPGEGRRVDLYV